jgi:hypothetical protein
LGVDFTQAGTISNPNVANLGWEFRAETTVTVVGLGVWDAEEYLGTPAFAWPRDQHVGLWLEADSGPQLLADTYVSMDDALVGNWRFDGIAPITLVAGETYVVGSQGGAAFTFDVQGFLPDPNIRYLGSRAVFVGDASTDRPLAYPSQADATAHGYLGANVLFGDATVPEPSALLLLLAGASVMAGLRRAKVSS